MVAVLRRYLLSARPFWTLIVTSLIALVLMVVLARSDKQLRRSKTVAIVMPVAISIWLIGQLFMLSQCILEQMRRSSVRTLAVAVPTMDIPAEQRPLPVATASRLRFAQGDHPQNKSRRSTTCKWSDMHFLSPGIHQKYYDFPQHLHVLARKPYKTKEQIRQLLNAQYPGYTQQMYNSKI